MSALRWNLMLGEWIIVAPNRGQRAFQQEDQECPFCGLQVNGRSDWRTLKIDNKYPALATDGGVVPLDERIVMEAPAYGLTKVILLSPTHDEQIEDMGQDQLEAVVNEYINTFDDLDRRKGIKYVMVFENRGKAAGVSLNHPHAQVYALPFIPPRIQQEIQQTKRMWEDENLCLVCETIGNEQKSGERIINESDNYLSLVPFAPRLPYEVHVYPKKHIPSIVELKDSALELGLMLQDAAKRYSKVFEETAYVMALHSRPSTGDHEYWHFHVEFYPPWRNRSDFKHLAGIELGAGAFTNDTLPEEVAEELREVL
jgi:UDPglucose--hexose-1-phosphate uridylyltransferase